MPLSWYVNSQPSSSLSEQRRMASRRFINIKFNVWHDIVLIQLNDRSLLCQLAALYDIPPKWNWSLTLVGAQSHLGGILYTSMLRCGFLSSLTRSPLEVLHSIGLFKNIMHCFCTSPAPIPLFSAANQQE